MNGNGKSLARVSTHEATLETVRGPVADAFDRFQNLWDDAFLCDVHRKGAA